MSEKFDGRLRPDGAEVRHGKKSDEDLKHRVDEIRRSPERARDDAVAAFELAYQLINVELEPLDRLTQARVLLDGLLAHYPKWPEALLNRAVARIGTGHLVSAIHDLDVLERILDLLPEGDPLYVKWFVVAGKVRLFRAEARIKQGNWDPEEVEAEHTAAASFFTRAQELREPGNDGWLKVTIDRVRELPNFPMRQLDVRVLSVSFFCVVVFVIGTAWIGMSRAASRSARYSEGDRVAQTGGSKASTRRILQLSAGGQEDTLLVRWRGGARIADDDTAGVVSGNSNAQAP